MLYLGEKISYTRTKNADLKLQTPPTTKSYKDINLCKFLWLFYPEPIKTMYIILVHIFTYFFGLHSILQFSGFLDHQQNLEHFIQLTSLYWIIQHRSRSMLLSIQRQVFSYWLRNILKQLFYKIVSQRGSLKMAVKVPLCHYKYFRCNSRVKSYLFILSAQ